MTADISVLSKRNEWLWLIFLFSVQGINDISSRLSTRNYCSSIWMTFLLFSTQGMNNISAFINTRNELWKWTTFLQRNEYILLFSAQGMNGFDWHYPLFPAQGRNNDVTDILCLLFSAQWMNDITALFNKRNEWLWLTFPLSPAQGMNGCNWDFALWIIASCVYIMHYPLYYA